MFVLKQVNIKYSCPFRPDVIYYTCFVYLGFRIELNLFSVLQPEKSFVYMLDTVVVHKDPYGVVLIMGAWNYPIQLTLLPVAGAIAAGNCVIIKPSEVSSASEKFIADAIPKYLDNVSEARAWKITISIKFIWQIWFGRNAFM